jgi:hypothetical protein
VPFGEPYTASPSPSIDADALTLIGHQQVLYTNNEVDKLGEIYFRLYPNLPQFSGQMQVQKATLMARMSPYNLPTSDLLQKHAICGIISA